MVRKNPPHSCHKNVKMKTKLFGVLLLIETAALLFTAAVAGHYHFAAGENDYLYFIQTACITGFCGLVLYFIGRRIKKTLQIKDTFLVVALAWVLFSAFGMLPFLFSDTIDNVTDAFFETMSGFTTTGATVLNNIDSLPHGILFWRSLMQWMGGLGIVVFTLAFLPSVAKGSKKMSLFAAEAPGLNVEKLAPTTQGTSRVLWLIYIILTILCATFYYIGPMGFFDSVCHALTTIATGGFSTHQASIGYFQSDYLEYICSIFMLMAGINFAMYHFLAWRRFDVIKKNEELRWYIGLILANVVLFVVLFLFAPMADGVTERQLAIFPKGFNDTVRTSLFHVTSLLSNTGFQASNFDYDLWGIMFVIPTLLLMVTGGCAGSTSGGIKVIRVIVLFKFIKTGLSEIIHPTRMFSIKISDQIVDTSSVKRVAAFLSLFIMLLVLNMLVLPIMGMGVWDSCSAFLTCISNYGPGSGLTGPSGSFVAVPQAAKWLLSFDMLVGRLEIFTILMLFTKYFWKTTK